MESQAGGTCHGLLNQWSLEIGLRIETAAFLHREIMKTLIKNSSYAILAAAPALAFVAYRLTLELWCIAYGLIY